ncbi:PLP-dependent transferase [bacterium]|nr:PLP-dependent transferase [bacterium]
MGLSTKAIHSGEEPNLEPGGSGDVVMGIHTSSTFARREVDKPTAGYEYSRSGNPTRNALEEKLAAIEDARFALAFASGLAAQNTLCLSLLKPGDRVVGFDDLYGGTRRLFEKTLKPALQLDTVYVDFTDMAAAEAALSQPCALLWLESPTNPLLKQADIAAIAKLGRAAGAVVVVDNTFMTPVFQRPLELGADIVLYSTTKYMNGHSDSVGGALVLSDDALHEKLRFNQNAAGAILSPFDSYLLMRGLKTLAVRMDAHQRGAMQIAQWLERHPRVKRVIYPGLPSHPQHELAKRQCSGFGGMISFELDGGEAEALAFLSRLRVFALAESLGGVESLIEHPALMTHASVPAEVRAQIGVSDSLIRVSVGIEDIEDLIEDLKQGFGG